MSDRRLCKQPNPVRFAVTNHGARFWPHSSSVSVQGHVTPPDARTLNDALTPVEALMTGALTGIGCPVCQSWIVVEGDHLRSRHGDAIHVQSTGHLFCRRSCVETYRLRCEA